MAETRLDWVDVAKGLAILIVVYYHAPLMLAALGVEVPWSLAFNEMLRPVRMPIFFAASGLFAAAAIRLSWPDLFTKRLQLLLYLFVVWTLIRFALFALLPNPQTPEEGRDLVWLVINIVQPGTGLWFVWCLALFFVLTKLLEPVPRPIVLGVAAAVSILAHSNQLPVYFTHENILRYFFFFYAACHYREIVGWPTRRPWMFAVGGIAAYLALYALSIRVRNPWIDGAIFFMGAMVGIAGLVAIAELLTKTRAVAGLRFIGQHTLSIYLVHVLFVVWFAYGARALGAAQIGPWAELLPVLSAAVAVGLSLLVELLAARWGGHWYLFQVPWAREVPRPDVARASR